MSHHPHLSHRDWEALGRLALALDYLWVPAGLLVLYLAIIGLSAL